MHDANAQLKQKKHFTRIHSLCQAVQDTQNIPTPLGFLANIRRRRCINITMTTVKPEHVDHVPLQSLLSCDVRNSRKLGKLTRQQRLSIAVTLASAVLQLHTSPWLSENWGTNDIYFFSNGVDKHNRPLIDLACVSRSFSSSANQCSEPSPY